MKGYVASMLAEWCRPIKSGVWEGERAEIITISQSDKTLQL
jgi:hypothetical protein